MATFTSSLPDKTLEVLGSVAKKLNKPKNQIIDDALNRYFLDLDKQAFNDSFERVGKDYAMQTLANSGLEDYVDQLKNQDANV